ncbi:HCP-like protein [Hesseltinella vesiculosa]|uniref:HCP-like protein n=1 Tax=Hesseltinella vesiculosa TaxID=101127 RepID=A0A1X2GDA2_9FUNG|nr:HCP-like protein [Hesseltinella vesiculosa]
MADVQWLSIDILPIDEQFLQLLEHKQLKKDMSVYKEVIQYVLHQLQTDKDVKTARVMKIIGQDIPEITALGNALLQNSKDSAPVAQELYRQAMLAGDDQGSFSYASMLYRGYGGTPTDEEEATKLFSRLSKKGHPYAQMNLASIIMRSHPQRVSDAIQLYELAGKSGVSDAYMELGRMYRLGYGVHQDHQKAKHYFQQGTENGMSNPRCHFMLGVYCSSPENESDLRKAFQHFQVAAAKGLPEAQYNVGLRYLKGQGVDANPYNAAEFFTMASLQDFQIAQVNLANMYLHGNGIKKDMNKASYWFGKAAALGGTIGNEAKSQLVQLQAKESNTCAVM